MDTEVNQIKIGIIGGGQLGRMMILEGKKLGLYFIVLDPHEDCPAASIVDELIVGDFYDPLKIKELAEKTNVVTYEFEHINVEILIQLQKEGHKIFPSPHTLKKIQDKAIQKEFLQKEDIAVANFSNLKSTSLEALYKEIENYGFPVMLKSCRGGYDGKGNYLIKSHEDVEIAYNTLGKGVWDLMIEEFVPFTKEISVVVARGFGGEMKVYPLCENIHEDNILKTSIFPARVEKTIEEKAKELALRTMEVLEGIGVFCVEMFVTSDGKVLVNEIAPRTHNSGHYTIEGCTVSQFAQHVRAILGLPLGDVKLVNPGVMINLLGEVGYRGKAKLVGVQEALALPQVFIHNYGKTSTASQRKMGHITVLGDCIEDALVKAEKAREIVKVIGEEVIHE